MSRGGRLLLAAGPSYHLVLNLRGRSLVRDASLLSNWGTGSTSGGEYETLGHVIKLCAR